MIEAYKAEYDLMLSTGLKHTAVVDHLNKTYTLSDEELAIANSWAPPIVPKQKTSRRKPAKALQPTEVLTTTAVVKQPDEQVEVLPPVTDDQAPVAVQEKISAFKEAALDHCISFMAKDAKFAEVKEFKDIVAVVDSIEKSYQKADTKDRGPTINILVQNLTERFRDDC